MKQMPAENTPLMSSAPDVNSVDRTAAVYLTKLLDLGIELGYRLQLSGAETFRVEESVTRLIKAYGIDCETFAVPNSLIVTVRTKEGETQTGLRRIGYHGTNIAAMEYYNALCRKLCETRPDIDTARALLEEEKKHVKPYSLLIMLAAYVVSSLSFAIFFGGGIIEALCAGICGLACGLTQEFLSWLRVNDFFKTILSGFVITFLAQTFASVGMIPRADATSIGAIMLLVPGMVFTNSMRDIIFGDTISGVNRLVQVFICAFAIGLGTGSAISLCRHIYGTAILGISNMIYPDIVQYVTAFVACLGFCFLFNIHGRGMFFCALGSTLSWVVYLLCVRLNTGEFVAYFIAAVAIATYSEIMARIRKFPATSYLLISLLPLVPGASIYYSIEHLLNDNTEAFLARVEYTAGTARALAVGVLLVSSIFRMVATWKGLHKTEHRFLRRK